ncbi:MAG: sirohydrochlorin chelatase, partial [Prevotella sp.]|nr:sirohydrochlorin chelatase [Prevotella sp.]
TKEHTKINYVDHALIEMGHDFANELMPLLTKASAKKKRIIVQGIYLTSDVKRMADRHKMTDVQKDLVKKTGVDIVYSADGILPACTPLVVDWIVAQTNKWVESKR